MKNILSLTETVKIKFIVYAKGVNNIRLSKLGHCRLKDFKYNQKRKFLPSPYLSSEEGNQSLCVDTMLF